MENKILTPHLSTSSDLRQRRQKIVTSDLKSEDDVDDGDNSDVGDIDDHSKLSSSVSAAGSLWFYWLRLCIGLVIMLMCGWGYASYVKQLHETHLWFSNIQDVEREISFRTESGLYYSYYKQLVTARSFYSAVQDLTRDNLTEHPSTVNVLSRMNIYQEVFLAAVYRLLPALHNTTEPVYFYIDVVFALHGLLLCSLVVTSWSLSESWFAGLLTALFYIFNRVDVTRVEQWIPLRENFALPFLWSQLAVLTVYFRPSVSPTVERYCRSAIAVFTFLFAVTWQFNQFALLLQAMALFAVQVLRLVDHQKILCVYLCHIFTMLFVCILQFFNAMIVTGFLPSFVMAALLIMWTQSRSSVDNISAARHVWQVVHYVVLVFVLTFLINSLIKLIIRQEADEHIYKFVLTKFGFSEHSRDFDVHLYLCNAAFSYLDFATFARLTRRLVFPIYAVSHCGLLMLLTARTFQSWRHQSSSQCKTQVKNSGRIFTAAVSPELAYHSIQAVFFGAVALTTLRMKFFWTPYMCIIATVLLASRSLWAWLLSQLRRHSDSAVQIVRHSAVIVGIVVLLYRCLPDVWSELEELREFYDPDTVELMNWIKANTSPTAAFAGSMQLLAGVKLCTGRPITNHPHYEDKALRRRTKELYQMYGRRKPEDVFEIMTKYSASYIILEDSHCLAPSRRGCRLPDLIDTDNGVAPDDTTAEAGLIKSDIPRFCDKVRYATPSYSHYFRVVFNNPTFRVYHVAHQPM